MDNTRKLLVAISFLVATLAIGCSHETGVRTRAAVHSVGSDVRADTDHVTGDTAAEHREHEENEEDNEHPHN